MRPPAPATISRMSDMILLRLARCGYSEAVRVKESSAQGLYLPGATAPRTPAFSIALVTKPDAIAASVNCLTKAAVSGRSLG